MSGTIPLGPFDLLRPIGRGGMAEVWAGLHRAQEAPVAVKVLTGERAREEPFIRALKNEIHNVARLHHPGIILLFDTGEVDEVAERESQGKLVAGSPWFAMELASHGSLSPKRLPLNWPTARMLLLSLLDALAHAHARGVIHRDIKPGNILLCAPDDPRPGLKLTDFGIAAPITEHNVDASAEEGRLSGTPRYMAPEQFTARWRDFGPWTDLYALGCIAYQLATGKTPFSGDALKLALAHCHEKPEPPKPIEGYPDGYVAWVLRLLEKDPQRRYACAADAAWALLRLEVPGVEDEITVVGGWEDALRSLKPKALVEEAAEGTGGPTAVLSPVPPSEERASSEGDQVSDSEGIEGVQPPSLLNEAAPDLPTAVDRPLAMLHGSQTSGSGVFTNMPSGARDTIAVPVGRAKFVSGSSENSVPIDSIDFTTGPRLPASVTGPTAPLPPELRDELFPRIVGPDEITKSKPKNEIGSGIERDNNGSEVRGDTTFAPNVPWTELAALSPDKPPKEAMPTVTGRAIDVPRKPVDEVDESILAPRLPPPMPPTWRRPGPSQQSRHLHGAGLGLYGLRQIPLVDRDTERDTVWDTLRAVHEGEGARVVIVRGPTGIGKSRLAEWLIERAAEVGAAVALKAGHGPGGGPLDGLPGMIALHARTIGLRKKDLLKRLFEVVKRQGFPDPEEAMSLAEVLEPGVLEGNPNEERVRLGSASERHAVILRYLQRVATDRPAVVWLDDVQWGADAIAFARMLISDERARNTPIMVLLSASEEELGEQPSELEALDTLAKTARAVEVRLPHLPVADHKALVQELLGLEQNLAGQVAARTAGNPLFAVQLVGDFVSRGVLELTPQGFALRRGERAVLPDDLHGVWVDRLARVLSRTPEGSQEALELGSILGTSGDDGEWQAVCDEAGIELSLKLIDELLIARLIVPDEVGLRFAHAMLRESVLRKAAEEGRLAKHHIVAARMLMKRYGDKRRGVAERVGRHLVAAGEIAESLHHLLNAADETARTAGYSHAHALLAERDAAIDALGLPEDDPRRAEGWIKKAAVLFDEGRYDEALMWSGLVLRYRDDPRHARVTPPALLVSALVPLRQARWDEAAKRFVEARDAAQSAGDMSTVTECLAGLSDSEYYRGRLESASNVLSQAITVCQENNDQAGMSFCLWNSAYCALWMGDVAQARELLLRQQKLARRVGHRSMIANGRNALGDVERVSGKYDDAERHYEEALKLFEVIGSGKRRVARVNLALNALARGNLAKAEVLVTHVLPEVERSGERVLSALCHGVLAAISASERDWEACDRQMLEVMKPHQETGLVDGEHALLFEIIGDHARAQGEDARASTAYENALDLWRALGRTDRVDGVMRALGTLGTVPFRKRPG